MTQQQQEHTRPALQRRREKSKRNSSSSRRRRTVFGWWRLLGIPLGLSCSVMVYTLYSFHVSFFDSHQQQQQQQQQYEYSTFVQQQQQEPRKAAAVVAGGLNLEKIQQIASDKRHYTFGKQAIGSSSNQVQGDEAEDPRGMVSSWTKKHSSSFRPQLHDFGRTGRGRSHSGVSNLLQPPPPRRQQQQRRGRNQQRQQQQQQQLGAVDGFLAWIGSWTGLARLVQGDPSDASSYPAKREQQQQQQDLLLQQLQQKQQPTNLLGGVSPHDDQDNNDNDRFDYTQIPIPTAQTLPRPQLYNLTAIHSSNSNSSNVPGGSGGGGGGIVIIVLSARNHFASRKAIRETWGRGQAVYFVIGGGADAATASDNAYNGGHNENTTSSSKYRVNHNDQDGNATTASGHEPLNSTTTSTTTKTTTSSTMLYDRARQQQLLEQEFQEHGDLLDTIHPESYRSLPFKLQFAYHWIYTHYRHDAHWEWILKVDDDIMVHTVAKLQHDVLRPLNGHAQPIVVGSIVTNGKVIKTGKWAEHVYPGRAHYSPNVNQVVHFPYYPYWPKGSCGHVVSRVVAEYVAQQFHPYHGNNESSATTSDNTNKSNTTSTSSNTNTTASISTDLVYYQGEDTSLGIWLDESPLSVIWIKSRYFTNDKHCPWQNENLHHRRRNIINNNNHGPPMRIGGGGIGGDLNTATKTAIVIGHDWTVQELRFCHAQLEQEEQQLEQRRHAQDKTTAIAAVGAAAAQGNKDRYLWFVETHEQKREMESNYFRSRHGKDFADKANGAAPVDFYETHP
jgi:hypothetical protein